MSDIAELEGRITAALERIGKGLARLEGPAASGPSDTGADAPSGDLATAEAARELAALREALDVEKNANAQLNERLRKVKERDAQLVAQLEARVEAMTRQLDVQGLEVQRMRKTTINLREHLRALREAQTAGGADAHMLNKVMLAELEALRAARVSEMAEVDEILAELTPLVQEVQIDA